MQLKVYKHNVGGYIFNFKGFYKNLRYIMSRNQVRTSTIEKFVKTLYCLPFLSNEEQ